MKPTLRTLPNGLKAIFVPCEAQSIAFGLFVESGSRHEPARLAGISHFLEHMLFKGTANRTPLEISRSIEGRGGNFNAFTGEETTAFYAHMPFEYLAEAVDIITDMYLHATIPEDEFVREKEVVLEEIKMYADEPDSVAMENLQRALFPESRLGKPVAGSAATLRPMTPGDLRDYLASHYRTGNTLAVLAGNFDPEKAAEILGRLRLRTGNRPRIRKDRFGAVRAEISAQKDVHETQLALGYRTFGVTDSRRYAATLLDAVMGRGMSSRLFQEVREKRGLSYDVQSRLQFFTDAGMWTVAAGLTPDKAAGALKVIDRELRRIAAVKVSAAELKRTQEFLIGNFRLSQEKVTAKLFHYAQAYLAFGRLIEPETQIDELKKVTPAEILAVAQNLLRPENRAVSWVTPKN